jgi:hypothetical protein
MLLSDENLLSMTWDKIEPKPIQKICLIMERNNLKFGFEWLVGANDTN